MEKAQKNEPQSENNPGLVILYAPDRIIHDALNQVGAPVRQAGTPEASATALKAYIYNIVLSTPVSEEENGVEQEEGVYFHEVFHCLSQDTYHRIVNRLKSVFVLDNTVVARWSVQVAAPPNPPLASLLRVGGDVGQGQVYITQCYVHSGIFGT